MAILTVQKPSLAGVAPTYEAADAAGDSFPNNGSTMVHVKNGGAAAITVTIDSAKACSYGFDHNIDVVIAAGAEVMLGPFPQARFNDTAQRTNLSYSAVTSVTVAVRAPA